MPLSLSKGQTGKMPTVKGGCKFSVGSWYKNLDPVITGLRDKEHATGWLTPVGSQVIFYVASVYFSCVRSGLPRGVGWPPRHFQRRARPKAKGTSQSLFSGMEQPGASLKRQVLSLHGSAGFQPRAHSGRRRGGGRHGPANAMEEEDPD